MAESEGPHVTMGDQAQAQVDDLMANSHHISKWVEEQPNETQASWAQSIFAKLLEKASQPRSVSGNACVKLCGFVEQASKSRSPEMHAWAFERHIALQLFDFYVEWSESDHHRSMRLVLELLPQLIKRNPDREAARELKGFLVDTLVAIVAGKSDKPVAKSAIKALDHLLTKKTVTLDEVRTTYAALQPEELAKGGEMAVWRGFFVELFRWMRLHVVCPPAGRFIVVLYRALRQGSSSPGSAQLTMEMWHEWLIEVLEEDASILEAVTQYVFLALFKADRGEALTFLRRMNDFEGLSASSGSDLDTRTLLQLAALETGKKVGLVEEPALGGNDGSGKETIVLEEQVLESVLAHPSQDVRSFAISLLISSPSTTRPYSPTALRLLQKHLEAYFSESDAKLRNDVSSKVRDMFKRVRGAIFVLKKSIPRAAAQKKDQDKQPPQTKPVVIFRANLVSLPEADLVECLRYHERFLFWYLGFLCDELAPTASYQRHIASLKAAKHILRLEGEKTKTWETLDDQTLVFDRFDGTWLRALSDLVMDPFDDVRDDAAFVLKQIFSDDRCRCFKLAAARGDAADATAELSALLVKAESLASRTARADHSDGVARIRQLLYRFADGEQARLSLLSDLVDGLEAKLAVTERDLAQAVLEAPLHGDFSSLCYTWQVVSELSFSSEAELQAVQGLQERIVSCGEGVWAAVRAILCDDSPEGHLPQELEEVDGLDTKDVLSYSFRAVHEASNLLRGLVQSIRHASQPGKGKVYPSRELYERIGNLSFVQLASLRHRGAFTTVASTFATCCQLAKYVEGQGGQDGQGMLQRWYEGTLDNIRGQASTTRRSAGIPAMMTGVLSADATSPSFEQAMSTLTHMASLPALAAETDGSNLPQVHAYNCLKDMFRSSALAASGNKSERYLPACLELAANALRSELWALRNCGLVLLRSLMDGLFGTHEGKATMEAGWDGKANRVSYQRYPSLPGVLVRLLRAGHGTENEAGAGVGGGTTPFGLGAAIGPAKAEAVFPALDMVRRAGPPALLRDELQALIAKYLPSPVWHVREMAARTLCSCLLHRNWLDEVAVLAKDSLQEQHGNVQNHVHGVLLTVGFVVERLRDVMPERLQSDTPKFAQVLRDYWLRIKALPSPEIAASYLQLVNLVHSLPRPRDSPLLSFDVPVLTPNEGALLRAQRTIHAVHLAVSSSTHPVDALGSLLLSKPLGINTLVVGLETISSVWPASSFTSSSSSSSSSTESASALCTLYIDICLVVTAAEPRVLALRNLTDLLDSAAAVDADALPSSSLSLLWNSLPASALLSPALANAAVRVSGCVLAVLYRRGDVSDAGLRNWGHMMAAAGLDDKDFDTRLAAAESLCSFFTSTSPSTSHPSLLPALTALYDALNDDDDDIRSLASLAARPVLGHLLVPPQAATRLLHLLTTTTTTTSFPSSSSSVPFRTLVVHRIMGLTSFPIPSTPTPSTNIASAHLASALQLDTSLFAVEDRNLFVDEAREARRWTDTLRRLDWSSDEDDALTWLVESVRDGLRTAQELADHEDDGPLGYASKPAVFAVLSRLARAAKVLMRCHPDAAVREEMEASSRFLRSGQGHLSGLLVRTLIEEEEV